MIGLLTAALLAPLCAETASFEAHHRPAAELAALVGFSMRGERPGLTADEKSNRVILSGSQGAVAAARALLADLDRAPRRQELEVVLEAGTGTVPRRPVWRARLALLSGVTGRVELGGAHGLTLPDGAKLASLTGRFTVTAVVEGLDVRGQLEVGLEGPAGARVLRLAGQARGSAGEALRMGEAATSSTQILGVVVTPR